MSDKIKLFRISTIEMPEDWSLVVGLVRTEHYRNGTIDLDRPPIEIPAAALSALGVILINTADE